MIKYLLLLTCSIMIYPCHLHAEPEADACSARIGKLRQECGQRPEACLELQEQYSKAAEPKQSHINLHSEQPPLPAEQLQELGLACEKHKHQVLCSKAVEQFWIASRFRDALELSDKICRAGIDANLCNIRKQFDGTRLGNTPFKAVTIPCGEFKADGTPLVSELTFTDRGIVTMFMESRLRARLENGLIKLRHDKGGDFIFSMVNADTLLGMDSWNRFGLYKRTATPAASTCQPPPIFREQPLSNGCGLDRNPQQCCDEGDTEGCNRLGNMAALQGKWREAALQYAKVCTKGVRIGCENWVYTVSKTGDDEAVEKGLQRLCKADTGHVACDLLDMNSITKMSLMYALEQTLQGHTRK